MTTLVWDQAGDKTYETGVDRGVLYLNDGSSAAWNGLTSVEDTSNSELKSYYMDGIKYLNRVTPGDFAGKIKAYTYPDEFERVCGIVSVQPGLSYYDQRSKSFSLAYRTKVGNDVEGLDFGYKIHLLYNLVAVPDSSVYETLKNPATPIEFAWTLSGIPQSDIGYRPTAHISIDSNETDPGILQFIENILYGTSTVSPRLPPISEIRNIFANWDDLIIIDNADGTWSASDVAGIYITMTDPTTFSINVTDSEYLDTDTWQIFSTAVVLPGDVPLMQINLRAPDDSAWLITADDTGYLNINSGASGDAIFDLIAMRSPNGSFWDIFVTNDGTIDVVSGPSTSIEPLNQVKLESPDETVWLVTVTNDGTLNIAPG